jgi:hypothetical protein
MSGIKNSRCGDPARIDDRGDLTVLCLHSNMDPDFFPDLGAQRLTGLEGWGTSGACKNEAKRTRVRKQCLLILVKNLGICGVERFDLGKCTLDR